jgi:hypothetical protein
MYICISCGEEKFGNPLKIVSLKKITLVRVEIIPFLQGVFLPKIFVGTVQT